MARAFDDGSTQYLRYNGAVVSAAPLTLACWINSDDLTIDQQALTVHQFGSTDFWTLIVEGAQAGDPIRLHVRGSDNVTARTTSGYSANTWHHICAVEAANNDRAVFIDGGGKGTNNTACVPDSPDTTEIGARGSFQPFSGSVAEAAVWNAALTDAEVAILATGYSPLFVKPENLVAYWPLIRDTDNDVVGGYDMTATNNPTVATHPPVVLYPVSPHITKINAIGMDIVWGHDTAVTETNVRDFLGTWTGTGDIGNPGVADTERLELNAGEYMISEVVNTGAVDVAITYNVYSAGDNINLDYRHGASVGACEGAGWNDYAGSFTSAGYVQVRVTSTL